jgi:hypothetical protein
MGVMSSGKASSRRRFHDAASLWTRCPCTEHHWHGLAEAAAEALAEGFDSAALRELAGVSVDDDPDEVCDVVDAAAAELDLPVWGKSAPPYVVHDDGSAAPRVAAESIRFDIVPTGLYDGFAINVYVDDVEMTSRAAGLGMAPRMLLLPLNGLDATPEPTVTQIARCAGDGLCHITDVRIQRDGGVVHWDWLRDAPARHGVTFDAEQYDAEVARLAADLTWERPVDTAERLLLTRADTEQLAAAGLTLILGWPDPEDPSLYMVTLNTADGFDLKMHFPIRGRPLPEVAEEALTTLAEPPQTWRVQFHHWRQPEQTGAPAMAGPLWTRFRSARTDRSG